MENDIDKLLTIESQEAVRKLGEINGLISKAHREFETIQKELPTMYEKRKAEEERAIRDALLASREIMAQAKSHYEKIPRLQATVSNVLGAVTKLVQTILKAEDASAKKSKETIEMYKQLKKDQEAFALEMRTENAKLDARLTGTMALEKDVVRRAGELQGRIDTLNLSK